jgi:hypothetical protein
METCSRPPRPVRLVRNGTMGCWFVFAPETKRIPIAMTLGMARGGANGQNNIWECDVVGKRDSPPVRDAASIDGDDVNGPRSCDCRQRRAGHGRTAGCRRRLRKWLCVKEKWVIAALREIGRPARCPPPPSLARSRGSNRFVVAGNSACLCRADCVPVESRVPNGVARWRVRRKPP